MSARLCVVMLEVLQNESQRGSQTVKSARRSNVCGAVCAALDRTWRHAHAARCLFRSLEWPVGVVGEIAGRCMVDVTGLEPATPCLQRLVARRINKLDGRRRIATECYKCSAGLGLVVSRRQPVALGRVWWWAQNRAQSLSVRGGRVVRPT